MDVNRAACRRYADQAERWFPISEVAANADTLPASVCRLCPIQQQCLEESLFKNPHGTWGGYNEWERRIIARRTGLVTSDAA